MKEYLAEKEEVLAQLSSGVHGISQKDVADRQQKYGKNHLEEGKKVTILERFLHELSDPMTIILVIAAVISAITAVVEGESFTDVIIILTVVVINAVLGVLQESKAEKAIEALQEITASTAKAIRDGKQLQVKSDELVPGDILVLEAGDAVLADARIIESASLKIEEAALTGESVPANKISTVLKLEEKTDIPLGDRKNMCYMGSSVVYGRGMAVVCATGMHTEIGKIAGALAQVQDEKTPLQMKLNQLSKVLSYLVLGICVVIFAVSLLRSWLSGSGIDGGLILDTFMVAVSLAVAAIPEGLAAVVTIVLSIGVTKMSKRHTVIRKMTAVETLGCTQIICSDKTGTLTQNRMIVLKHVTEDVAELVRAMALCSDAKLDEDHLAIGEPTECALVQDAYAEGMDKRDLEAAYIRVGEVPFDSVRKMMTTVHRTGTGELIQYTKGAPDEVLKRCTHVWRDQKEEPMTDTIRTGILAENKAMADQALRVLCAARRSLTQMPECLESDKLEHDLCYLGLSGMMDPVRPEVIAAIDECREAGIRPVMITGDHKDTAAAIAMQLHIISDASEAITGAELDTISDAELLHKITQYSVYARVQPEHKVRIVQAWKAQGKVVAMTGDGVNDAPSIKNADIGIGMGITGTDVTKNVADMVLADDNFATIVSAVEEGRRIYDNIRKAIQFLLASNLAEVLSVFIATLLGFVVLKPVHLLWINLITDCFPALALGMEQGEPDIMKKKPREGKEGIFAGGMGVDIIFQGGFVTLMTLVSYVVGHRMEAGVWEITQSADGMTMAFLTLSMIEIFHSFNMRSRRGSVFKLRTQNLWLWGAMLLSLLCTTAVIEVPVLAAAFGFEQISLREYLTAMGLACTIIPAVELVKLIQRTCGKKRS